MRNSWRAALVTALVAGACSSGERAGSPAPPSGGAGARPGPATPAVGGDDSSAGASLGGGGGGAAGEAGQGAAGPPSGAGGVEDAGGAGEGAGGEPTFEEPFPEPICLGSGELSGAVKLAISTAEADQFGSITPDELVIAWTTVAAGDQVTLHYARRASVDDEFGDVRTLELAAALDSVSLSFDGLRLVYVNPDRKGFAQLIRPALDQPFGELDSRDFSPIVEAAEQFAADEYVGDPVLGPDDYTFFYSHYGADRTKTLARTLRFSRFAPWPAGPELAVAPTLEAANGQRQRPTGVSLDGQTLFIWDSVAASQRVAVLSHDTSRYDVAFELGDARGAAPNGACSRVYYDANGELWSADLL